MNQRLQSFIVWYSAPPFTLQPPLFSFSGRLLYSCPVILSLDQMYKLQPPVSCLSYQNRLLDSSCLSVSAIPLSYIPLSSIEGSPSSLYSLFYNLKERGKKTKEMNKPICNTFGFFIMVLSWIIVLDSKIQCQDGKVFLSFCNFIFVTFFLNFQRFMVYKHVWPIKILFSKTNFYTV